MSRGNGLGSAADGPSPLGRDVASVGRRENITPMTRYDTPQATSSKCRYLESRAERSS